MAQYNREKKEDFYGREYPDSRHLDGMPRHSDKRRSSASEASKNDSMTESKARPASHSSENGGDTAQHNEFVPRDNALPAADRHMTDENIKQNPESRRNPDDRRSSGNRRNPRGERLPEGSGKRNGGKKKKSSIIYIVIIIVAACVLAFAIYKLIDISSGYKEAANTYDDIAEMFIPEKPEKTTKEGETEAETETTTEPFEWNYDSLLAINGESVGWIRDGGIINYPIVHCTNEDGNSKYLYTLIDGTPNDCGTLFVDKNIPTGLTGNYSIVYGHNMNDHSMFGSLLGYQDSSYYQSKPEMDVYIGYDHYVYKVFAAFTTEVTSFVYTYSLDDEESFNNFVYNARSCNEYTMYTGDITFGVNNIITLSTCISANNDDYRYVVMLCRDHIVKD